VFVLKEGTLYPMLHSLENWNAIESYWVNANNGNHRKHYTITSSGRKLLKQKKVEWILYTETVYSVIGGACNA